LWIFFPFSRLYYLQESFEKLNNKTNSKFELILIGLKRMNARTGAAGRLLPAGRGERLWADKRLNFERL